MLDLSKLEGKRIGLEQKHIDAGIRGAVRHHPIALALNDAVDDSVLAEICLVREALVFCTVIGREKLAELYTTSDLEAWAWAYERGEQVSPATLTIFKQDDETDSLWLGLDSDPKQSRKTLVRVVNHQTCKEVETLLLCDKHLAEVSEVCEDRAPQKSLITVARHLKGICEMCCADEDRTPITYHPVADTIIVHVVFLDGSTATWDGHGGVGKLDYLREDDGGTYTTMEALKARGVRCFTLENMHEVEVD